MSIGVLLWRWGEGCSHVFQYHANLFSGLLISSLCVPQCFWKNLFAEAPYSVTVFFWNLPFKDSPPLENISLNLLPSTGDSPTGPSRNYRELLELFQTTLNNHSKDGHALKGEIKDKTRFAKNVIKVDDSSRKCRKIFSFDFVYRLWLSSSQTYPKLKYGKQLQYNCFPPYP